MEAESFSNAPKSRASNKELVKEKKQGAFRPSESEKNISDWRHYWKLARDLWNPEGGRSVIDEGGGESCKNWIPSNIISEPGVPDRNTIRFYIRVGAAPFLSGSNPSILFLPSGPSHCL